MRYEIEITFVFATYFHLAINVTSGSLVDAHFASFIDENFKLLVSNLGSRFCTVHKVFFERPADDAGFVVCCCSERAVFVSRGILFCVVSKSCVEDQKLCGAKQTKSAKSISLTDLSQSFSDQFSD